MKIVLGLILIAMGIFIGALAISCWCKLRKPIEYQDTVGMVIKNGKLQQNRRIR